MKPDTSDLHEELLRYEEDTKYVPYIYAIGCIWFLGASLFLAFAIPLLLD